MLKIVCFFLQKAALMQPRVSSPKFALTVFRSVFVLFGHNGWQNVRFKPFVCVCVCVYESGLWALPRARASRTGSGTTSFTTVHELIKPSRARGLDQPKRGFPPDGA